MGVTHKDRGEHIVGDLTVLDDLVIHDDVTITGDIVLAGDFTIGEAGTGSDLLIYGDGTGASVLFDADENLCQFTEYDLQIGTQAAPRTRTSATNDHYTVGIFSHIEADEDTTLTLRSLWARFAVDANVQVGSAAGWGEGINAIEGNVKLYGGKNGTETQIYCWQIAGVWAMLECDNTDGIHFENGSHAAGLFAHIELGQYTEVETGGVAAAVVAFSNSHASAVIDGDYVGVYVDMESGKKAFTHGIKVEDSVSTTGLDIGSSTTGIVLTGTITTGISITSASLDDAIKISATTPVDGIEISSVCSGNAINISGTQTTTFFDATLSTTGSGRLDGIDFNWTSATTYGTTGDRIRGNGQMEGFLTIGDQGAASTISGAGSHVAIYTNLDVTATLASETEVVGGGYHVITLSQIPTTNMGILSPVTGYMRNAVVCDGSTEFFGARAVIYTASTAESVSQSALEVAIVDETGTRATAADIKAIMLELNVADVVDTNCQVIGICLEETGAAPASDGIKFRAGTFTRGIDFGDYCTTAIDIGDTTTGISFTGSATTGVSIAATGMDDAILISGTTPVDGIHISSVCSGHAINISGTQTTTFFDATLSTTGVSKVDGIDFNWTSATTYGASGDRIRGATGNMEAFLTIGDDQAASTISGAGSHLAIYTNLDVTATLSGDTDVVGGGYHVITLSQIPTTNMGIIVPVTGYIRNTVVCDGSTEFIGSRAVIYTASNAESVSQIGFEVAIIDQTAARATAADIKGLQVTLNIADVVDSNCHVVGIQLEEEGAAAASEGIYFSTGTWTTGIDFNDQCTTAIDIGTTTATGINFTGTIVDGIDFASATPTFGANNAFIGIGTYTSAMTIASLDDVFIPLQIHLDNTGNPGSAKDLAAARFRVDCITNPQGYVNANVIQTRQGIDQDVASFTNFSLSTIIGGAVALTNRSYGMMSKVEGSGAVTGGYSVNAALLYHTGGASGEVFCYEANVAASATATSMLLAKVEATGTTREGVYILNAGTMPTGLRIKTVNGTITDGIVLEGTVTHQMKLSNGVYFITGSADPNGSVSAVDGSIYLRTGTATANTILYVCKGTTQWEALGTG